MNHNVLRIGILKNASRTREKLVQSVFFRNNKFETKYMNFSITNNSTAEWKAVCLISGRGRFCLRSGLRSWKNSLRFRIRLAGSQLFSGKRFYPAVFGTSKFSLLFLNRDSAINATSVKYRDAYINRVCKCIRISNH